MALLNTHIGSASEFISKVENTNIIFAAEGINRICMIKGLKTCWTHQGCPKNKNKGEKVSDFERKPIRRGNELHGDFM